MRSRSKKVRRLKPPLLNVAKTMGKWKPSDDYLLIQSVAHLENLQEVHVLTNFSRKFSLEELKNRWFAILYDAPISRMIYKNLKKIHTDDILRLKKLIPFNLQENSILLYLPEDNPNEESYQKLLNDYRKCFFESRTVECLRNQYEKLKSLGLLNCQIINKYKQDETDKKTKMASLSFEKVEEKLAFNESNESTNPCTSESTTKESEVTYEMLTNQIKRAEADLFLWQMLVDKVSGSPNFFSEPDTIAVFFNEDIIFPMKKREIKIGRSSDADIKLTSKKCGINISRIQCTVGILDANKFYLINNGRPSVYIDGRPVIRNKKTQLSDKSIIEVGKISLLFLVNYNNISLVNSSDFTDQLSK